MPGASSSDSNQTSPTSRVSQILDRRLPLYVYLEPLFVGRRVLELGCGAGAGADYLAARGAAHVMALDLEAGPIERARSRYRRANLEFRSVSSLAALGPADLPELYDVVVVPEGEALLRRAPEGAASAVLAWRGLLTTGGRLVVAASSADRRGGGAAGGLGYYELSDALLPHFPRVQMFGVTPFAGFGVVEFDAGTDGLRIDSRLVEEEAEPPSAYVAVAGADAAEGLGYALVQVPFSPIESELLARDQVDPRTEARFAEGARRLEEAERRGRVRVEEAEGRIGELRRKLEDASVQSESAMRIARAQGEEIEELRARLRRAAEDRGAQDAEIGKLRRALAEADESVMSLTRRTAEEMSAVAERLAAGLRFEPPEPRERERLTAFSSAREREEQARAREEIDRLRVVLAETEARASAAEQRLEEVATDARERQARLDDAFERLRLSEDAIARERREVGRLQEELREVEGTARALDESEQALAARDDRIARLEGEKQDLAWRLAELEERLREAIARAVVSEGTRGQSEELGAARAARDRALAEFHRAAGAHVGEVTELRAAVAEQAALVAELEDAVAQAEGRATAAITEAGTLRKNAKALEDADRTRRTRLAELEGKLLRLEHERAAAAARGVPAAANGEAERRFADLARERDALRADLTRGGARVAELEAEVARLAARPPEAPEPPEPPASPEPGEAHEPSRNGHDPALAALARELDGIHSGLRAEVDALADIERTLGREGQMGAGAGADVGGSPAAESLLSATLDNYRRRASRLHDELEGIRRRWESLSAAEISGYLEELGEDLAELEK
jgi:chromosome segregation ATPase